MKALSVRQPWAWAIFHGKDIENRFWSTRFRGTVAIHAAKGMTQEEYESARDFMFGNVALTDMPLFGQCQRGAIVGLVDIVDCVTESDSPWFQGDYGFVLVNPRPLKEPIPCRGMLNFWDVPAEIVKQIEEGLNERR
jgi:hypothetical protein